MKRYIGTKLINAKSMTRQAYNDFRGWTVPDDENGGEEGYFVEYVDGGEGNTDYYDGYVSWSPAEVFERSYRQCNGLTFGQAIEALKAGQKVARSDWNGKGMCLVLVPGQKDVALREGYTYLEAIEDDTPPIEILPHIAMRVMLPGWLASQTDMMSEDWVIIE